MRTATRAGVAAAAGLAMSATALAGGNLRASAQVKSAEARLLAQYPGARIHHAQDGLRYAYGKRMTSGLSAVEASDLFLAEHGAALGVSNPQFVPTWGHPLGSGRLSVFAYQQEMDGLPVELGLVRVAVHNPSNSVVYAAGRLVERPAGGFRPDRVTSSQALVSVQTTARYAALGNWSAPQLVVYAKDVPEQGLVAHRAWKFEGSAPSLANYERFTFFVDASTGELLDARDEVYTADLTGTVRAWASPGTLPDIASNVETLLVVPETQVTSSAGNVFTGTDGTFTIAFGGAGPVNVSTNASSGRWVNVNDQSGTAEITATVAFTGGVPGAIELNGTRSQQTTAQANALIHTSLIHTYVRSRSNYTGLDVKIPANVNIGQNCNAFFSPDSINFYVSGGGCNNTSYSSVVAHEYGHFIVDQLQLAQGGFGEGFGDTCSMLLYDDPIIGRNFTTSGGSIRTPDTTNRQYPCTAGAVHACGEILAGAWWEVRKALGTTYGSSLGLAITQQLHVDWLQVTAGGTGTSSFNSAHPGTVIEILTMDDDDGDLSTGTPNFSDICSAFAQHNIPCPDVSAIGFQFPDGLPESVVRGEPTSVRVNVRGNLGTPVAGSGELLYRIDNGSLQSAPLSLVSSSGVLNEYTATLPALNCGQVIRYGFSSDATNGLEYFSPTEAPTELFFAPVGELVASFTDLGETSTGWVVTNDGTLSDGAWSRGVPVGGGDRGDPAVDADGSGACWLTDNVDGNSDVDNGATTLTSPVMDASAGDAYVSYNRWFTNDNGGATPTDTFLVQISGDNGANWVDLEVVGPEGDSTLGGWVFKRFRVADFVTPSANVRVRFVASDLGGGSIVEAGVDTLTMEIADCEDPSCPGDANGDTSLDAFDFNAFVDEFNAGNLAIADQNGDTSLDAFDFNAFVDNFNAGCP